MLRIEAKGLTKEFKSYISRPGLAGAFRDLFNRQYKTLRAVDHIDLEIAPGEIVGYIGENGAGKSTTIKMLTGILMPTSGYLRVNGMDPHRDREKFVRTIGVVFGQRSQLWWDIAVQESFTLLKKVYRLSDEEYKRHMGHVIEVLEIEELLTKPVRKLSLGQRMRCELAAALIHNPPLLFLDEPTIGLDVLVKLKIREFLKEINQKYGTTILLTTHDLSDIEALSSRVIMLDNGKIIYDGGLNELRTTWGNEKKVMIEFTKPADLNELKRLMGSLPVTWQKENDLRFRAVFEEEDLAVSDLLARIISRYEVKDISVEAVSTEEIVRKIYQEGIIHA
ncbi:ATP-binding cassette domain-containing protein [Aneurinibacillus thermoaerophilus]|uniref:ABC-2 type transport system ATP-binding protein n=1 Tax=Aneurinibacillus thermoaerophilus TaxID=143495 RepID=A0A1G8A8H0_ANETH|nr:MULTISPECIES: ATP-binding cassette domain-containing protein [Aneurinibacillus]AMA74064.1 daunorubicin ABC transporter ATP-binding protein [Aneurinibacillus sp. XH2]MED0678790.1 ATP-binding cassette domain-containing protein [Aneurinibacillus thermoaerophilus]MED0758318.1 ATP-binding cassette domain-containing protein [Aneurinibacillus thermoaerophilus]MED0759875.1 ATP-binding cassette domain-containing protein [Aneurinibacillus thermoaerophilus]MED0765195.1 ATP-binding cassette domain-cont